MSVSVYAVNGIDLFVREVGEGPPLLLLHGFTGCGQNWEMFEAGLLPGRRLIIPDLRGHGRSTNPGGELTHRLVAQDLGALLDAMGLAEVDAVGVSFGGNALLHLAITAPGRLRAMVLVSATPWFGEQARAFQRKFTLVDQPPAFWTQMRQWHPRGDAQIRALWATGRGFAERYDDMNLTPPQLATITARTLIVAGDRDPLYPLSLQLQLPEHIPDASLWVLPGGGHSPIYDPEHRERFVALSRRFLGVENV